MSAEETEFKEALRVTPCLCGHMQLDHGEGGKYCNVKDCTCSLFQVLCACGHSSVDHDMWGGGGCVHCDCKKITLPRKTMTLEELASKITFAKPVRHEGPPLVFAYLEVHYGVPIEGRSEEEAQSLAKEKLLSELQKIFGEESDRANGGADQAQESDPLGRHSHSGFQLTAQDLDDARNLSSEQLLARAVDEATDSARNSTKNA